MLYFPPASNAADWAIDVIVDDDATGLPFDLTGYTVEIELRAPTGEQALLATTLNSLITITAEGFAIEVPEAVMKSLLPGTYALHGRVKTPAGKIVQILEDALGVYDGGFN